MLDDVGVGREDGAVGRAIGIGMVRDSRFELRDATDSDLVERVSMTLSSSIRGGSGGASSAMRGRFVSLCSLPPHCAIGVAWAGNDASIASSRLLWMSTICCGRRAVSFRRRGVICGLPVGVNGRDAFWKGPGQ